MFAQEDGEDSGDSGTWEIGDLEKERCRGARNGGCVRVRQVRVKLRKVGSVVRRGWVRSYPRQSQE